MIWKSNIIRVKQLVDPVCSLQTMKIPLVGQGHGVAMGHQGASLATVVPMRGMSSAKSSTALT